MSEAMIPIIVILYILHLGLNKLVRLRFEDMPAQV